MKSAADLARLSTLLEEAMDLDEAGRTAWLAALAESDAPLSQTLRMLLEAHASRETGNLLDAGPLLTGLAGAEADNSAFFAGERVGTYVLEHEIGRGGMGEVWLAVREDGQLKRSVALKLPLLNARRSVLVQRFARERDILGSLSHPNIARLYDAGVDSEGQPYLALEYVEGGPVTTFCEKHALDTRGRVALMQQILRAVQYAHANLVIHRDLKPSNVLVTEAGHAMLLDFGIAKLLQEDTAEAPETELTRLGGRAMTLHYAAPEQVSGAPVSIATDVWALGVLLYELLAGRRPFSGRPRELEQAILSVDPSRPSAIPADLATIVLKALKKLPADRYATVDALAADLRRWQAGEAVQAQPDSLGYRTRKFVTRHRLGVAAAVGVVVTVLATSTVSLWQANEAREQARIARTESATAQAVQDFLEQLFQSNTMNQAHPAQARAKTAEQLLNEGAARIDGVLRDAPDAKLRVMRVLAGLYGEMNESASQLKMAEKRLRFANQAFPGASQQRVEALTALSVLRLSRSEQSEGLRLLAEARGLLAQHPKLDPEALIRAEMNILEAAMRVYDSSALDAAHHLVEVLQKRPPSSDLVGALFMQGSLERVAGQPARALESEKTAIAVEKQVPGGVAGGLGVVYMELSGAQADLGDMASAESSQRTALGLSEANTGPFGFHTFVQMQRLAHLLIAIGRPAEALLLMTDAQSRLARMPASKAEEMSRVLQGIAGVLVRAHFRLGHPERALAPGKTLGHPRVLPIDETTVVVPRLSIESRALVQLGRFDEARASLAAARAAVPPNFSPVHLVRESLAQAEMALALASGPVGDLRQRLQATELSTGADAYAAEAEVALATENSVLAEQLAQLGLAQLETTPNYRDDPYHRFRLQVTLSRAQLAQQRAGEALRPLQSALAWNRVACDPASSPDRLEALVVLAEVLASLGRDTESGDALREAGAIRAQHSTLGPQYTRPLESAVARLARRPP